MNFVHEFIILSTETTDVKFQVALTDVSPYIDPLHVKILNALLPVKKMLIHLFNKHSEVTLLAENEHIDTAEQHKHI